MKNVAETMYTRLGDFHINGEGTMVTKEGFKLMGTPLEGSYTRLRPENRHDPYGMNELGNSDLYMADNPFRYSENAAAQELHAPGRAIGNTQEINLSMDPRNGKYLGIYDEIKIGEDGIVYGKDGNNLVSLYKIQLAKLQ